jgi:hypothetical protein
MQAKSFARGKSFLTFCDRGALGLSLVIPTRHSTHHVIPGSLAALAPRMTARSSKCQEKSG